nr:immunoglobulin light chain junction region [Macaca mulatta]MOW10897.1 immunoglobulin light chain junction region [Macaca mulatta]
CQQGYGTPYSF